MGSKGSYESPPPAVPPPSTSSDMAALEMLMAQQAAMMPAMMAAMTPPETPSPPPIYTTPEIDWTDRTESIAQAMKAEASLDRARKIGREDTVLTSPLLGDEEAQTTQASLLVGTEDNA